MSDFSWYWNRLKTMSAGEVLYRFRQFSQKQSEKHQLKKSSVGSSITNLKDVLQNSYIQILPSELIRQFSDYNSFSFFKYTISLNDKIDWHLDIDSGKRFPMSFAKDIDIRSDKYGSAKIVWEINRLQFLLPLVAKYSQSGSKEDLELFIHFVESWISGNPYLKGVNWYSNIEINIRLIVWYYCWQVLLTVPELKSNDRFNQFVKHTWIPSIYEHCVYSYSNPSKYSSANNHLVAEYSGLFMASCCWQFEESDKWRNYAAKGLEKEIQIQHTQNGINKEEAAEYIQFITDFFLLPFSTAKHYGFSFSGLYKEKLGSIFDYIYNLLDCSGGYCKYGDEDDGKVLVTSADPHFDNFSSILVSAAVIFGNGKFKSVAGGFDLKNWLLWGQSGKNAYENIPIQKQPRGSAFYKEGHFLFRKEDIQQPHKEIYLHFDAAPLGFLSIAAHGHADALSVALHLDGQPIIADIGTYTYHTEKAWRNYFVSTLAHNTICIDYQNQALQAGPTMWLDHYKVTVSDIYQDKRLEQVTATHNGYRKIGCNHTRKVNFYREEERFVIEDSIGSKGNHVIILPWHLHPDIEITKVSDNVYDLKHKAGNRKCRLTCELSLSLVSGQTEPRLLGWYSPFFMKKTSSSTLFGILNVKSEKQINIKTIIEII